MSGIICECCQAFIPADESIPQVDDELVCTSCGAVMRLIDVTFEPILVAVLKWAPNGHDDDFVETPLEIPIKRKN